MGGTTQILLIGLGCWSFIQLLDCGLSCCKGGPKGRQPVVRLVLPDFADVAII